MKVCVQNTHCNVCLHTPCTPFLCVCSKKIIRLVDMMAATSTPEFPHLLLLLQKLSFSLNPPRNTAGGMMNALLHYLRKNTAGELYEFKRILVFNSSIFTQCFDYF